MMTALRLLVLLAALLSAVGASAGAARPNIVWISCEDTSPWFGFCGDKAARTPNLDALAKRGVHYTNAYVSAPVCSPCRSGLIAGMNATALGTQGLRSKFAMPDFVQGFPTYLRKAGYYCTNNSKTDYNTSSEPRIVRESWDQCSGRAHWKNRTPGQPFFAVFNLMETHQSKIFENTPAPSLEPNEVHDPATIPLPPYYPDIPEARRTMARVYDCITAMDKRAGRLLAELDEAGLRDNTIVFFWPDHGQGIPRGKRTLWDTGLKIPLVVAFPPKYAALAPAAAGAKCKRLVSTIDFAPTLLSLVGLPIPRHMQGTAFLGAAAGPPRRYVYGARDRVDEAIELSRAVRDERFLYIRNYMPHLSWNQPEWFSDQLDLRRAIARLAAEGKLNADQLTYAGPTKPAEALYDSQNDPWQLHNLAADPAHKATLERFRVALRAWQIDCRDLGFLSEERAGALCAGEKAPWDAARTDAAYPLARVLDTADMVGRPETAAALAVRLADGDPTVRYWAAVGLRAAGKDALAHSAALQKALSDPTASVQVEAAGVLVSLSEDPAALKLLTDKLLDSDPAVAVHAGRTLQLLGEKARPGLPAVIEALPRLCENAQWSARKMVESLTGEIPSPPTANKKKGAKR